jgi:hypothetical protein
MEVNIANFWWWLEKFGEIRSCFCRQQLFFGEGRFEWEKMLDQSGEGSVFLAGQARAGRHNQTLATLVLATGSCTCTLLHWLSSCVRLSWKALDTGAH